MSKRLRVSPSLSLRRSAPFRTLRALAARRGVRTPFVYAGGAGSCFFLRVYRTKLICFILFCFWWAHCRVLLCNSDGSYGVIEVRSHFWSRRCGKLSDAVADLKLALASTEEEQPGGLPGRRQVRGDDRL